MVTVTQNNLDGFHKHNVQLKKPDTQKNTDHL